MRKIAILLLAAGRSSRMRGADKLMQVIDGQPLITRSCQRALHTDLPCYVALPNLNHPRARACAQSCATANLIEVSEAAEGMGASIRTGVRALPDEIEAVMILPGDMPDLETEDLARLASHFTDPGGPILRATAEDGTPGHPVLFPRATFAELSDLKGDQGGRSILQRLAVQLVPLPGRRALTDLDTSEAWEMWRAKRNHE